MAAKLTKLEDQRRRVQRDLDAAELALDVVRETTGIIDLDERDFRHTITIELASLELEENKLILEIRQIEAIISTLEELARGPITQQIENMIENDHLMASLVRQITNLEAILAGRLTKFGENHRVVQQTRELINENKQKREQRRAEIAEQTRQGNLADARDSLVVQLRGLEQLEEMRKEAELRKKDLDMARTQYDRRVAIRNERRKQLDSYKTQIEKYKTMLLDPETPKVQFAGYAPVPLEMSSPKKKVFFPGGLVLGMMLGVGLAFLIELLNDLIRTPRDVTRYLRIPLLGVIPDATEDASLDGIDLCHVVRQAPYSIVSESYRRFRTNFKLSIPNGDYKTLLVSSGMAGDGKTSVAANLATTFVAEGKRVLLVDANFWQPSLHKVFADNGETQADIELPEFGLSTLLSGLCGYHEVINPTGIDGFDVIYSGLLPANPAELLGGAQMEQLIKRQREAYDYVILDGPPVLLVSDTKVLARLVDGTILVFNADATRRGAAQRTIRELREVNASIVGSVLLATKAMKGGYFNEQYKSYQEYQKLQLAHSL